MTIRTIVKRYEGVFQRGFLYDRGKRELRVFLAEPQTSCWLYADDRFKQITDLDQLGRNLSGSVLLQLTTNPIEFTLVWEVVTQHEVTCTVEVVAQARIVQGADFCARWQDCLQGGNVPDRVRIENRVVESKRPFVVDTLASYSFDQLVEKDEVPSAAWREWLCDA
ncbi:MAG: hypothetical protein PHQ75_09015, partial [Thermoguttaceae bacterium]|nr:hypothetical protein [Thermoguttaceae bacterium]